MRIDDRVVLVTGASSGIGAAVAEQLAVRGARLLVHGRDVARLERVAAGVGGTALAADLLAPDGVRGLADRALEAHGRLDAVVHSAGVGWSGPLEGMSEAAARDLLRLDLEAPVELTRLVLPGMLRQGAGNLCFVSSIAARTGVAGEAVYSAAKAGLDGFAESVRYELAGTGVEVSVVVPGAVDTPFFARRGRAYGRRIPRQQSAAAAAAAVVSALEQDRAEVFVPRWLRVVGPARGLSPSAFRRLNARFGERPPARAPDRPTRHTPGGGAG